MNPNIEVSQPSSPALSSIPNISPQPSSSPGIVEQAQSTVQTATSGTNWGKILLYGGIIIFLAFLGFNIFNYLSNVTQTLTDILQPILSVLGKGVSRTVGTTVKVGAEGTKGIIDATSGTITGGLSRLEGRLDDKQQNKIDSKSPDTDSVQPKNRRRPRKGPEPDEAGSRTQRGTHKSGYCYIGEDRGFRSCIRVNEGDECMSGDIFPTRDLCINPSLRE